MADGKFVEREGKTRKQNETGIKVVFPLRMCITQDLE
jgi:hypothetical protein